MEDRIVKIIMGRDEKMKISSIKKTAKERLSGNWGKTILTLVFFGFIQGLIYWIFNGPANIYYHDQLILGLEETLPAGPTAIISFITTILSSVIGFGFSVYLLKLIRDEDRCFSDLFYYFKSGHQFLRAALTTILVTIFVFLWLLLFVFPGIIKAIAYSQVNYILKDHPDMKPLDAITLSKRMMNGYKWKYFLLCLSFIGWALLVIITLGIAFLYVGPYSYAAITQFYEEVKEAYEAKGELI